MNFAFDTIKAVIPPSTVEAVYPMETNHAGFVTEDSTMPQDTMG